MSLPFDESAYNPVSLLEGLLESFSTYAIIVTDDKDRIVLWNRGAQALFKYRAKEVTGNSFTISRPKDGDESRAFNTVIKTKFGESVPVNIAISACHSPDGSFNGKLHVLRDITYKTLKESLLEALVTSTSFLSEEKPLQLIMQDVVDHIQLATRIPLVYICLTDDTDNFFVSAHSGIDKRILNLNCRISGTHAVCMSEGCKKACESGSFTMEGLSRHHISQYIDHKEYEELSILHTPLIKDGIIRGVLHFVVPESIKEFYANQKELLAHMASLIVSIMAFKTLEGELKEYVNNLETIVTKRTEEIRQKDAFIIQSGKLATLGEMAAGVAHEINQPLGGISLIVQGLKKAYEKGVLDSDMLSNRLSSIHEQIDRITRIISHLRDFSRQAPSYVSPIDVNKPINNVMQLVYEQLKHHHIRLNMELSETLPKVMAENNKLEQVILNLISNARDALDDQEKYVKKLLAECNPTDWAKTWEKLMEIRTYQQEQKIIIAVRDTAGGIRGHILDRIFEPFFTTKEVGKGTGLGLSISYGIIKSFSGEIKVETAINEGSTFYIILPVAGE